MDRWRRAFAVQPSDSAISTNGRARLWASKPEPNDLMLVLHRPIEPTGVKRTKSKQDAMSAYDPKRT